MNGLAGFGTTRREVGRWVGNVWGRWGRGRKERSLTNHNVFEVGTWTDVTVSEKYGSFSREKEDRCGRLVVTVGKKWSLSANSQCREKVVTEGKKVVKTLEIWLQYKRLRTENFSEKCSAIVISSPFSGVLAPLSSINN